MVPQLFSGFLTEININSSTCGLFRKYFIFKGVWESLASRQLNRWSDLGTFQNFQQGNVQLAALRGNAVCCLANVFDHGSLVLAAQLITQPRTVFGNPKFNRFLCIYFVQFLLPRTERLNQKEKEQSFLSLSPHPAPHLLPHTSSIPFSLYRQSLEKFTGEISFLHNKITFQFISLCIA